MNSLTPLLQQCKVTGLSLANQESKPGEKEKEENNNYEEENKLRVELLCHCYNSSDKLPFVVKLIRKYSSKLEINLVIYFETKYNDLNYWKISSIYSLGQVNSVHQAYARKRLKKMYDLEGKQSPKRENNIGPIKSAYKVIDLTQGAKALNFHITSTLSNIKNKLFFWYMQNLIKINYTVKINIYNILEIFSITIVKIIFVKGIKNKLNCFINFKNSENWIIKSIFNFIIYRGTYVLIIRNDYILSLINSLPEIRELKLTIYNNKFIPFKELYENPLIYLLEKNITFLLIYLSNTAIFQFLYMNFIYLSILVFSTLFLCYFSSFIFIIYFTFRIHR